MFDVENCNKACEFYTLMPVSNGGNGISDFVLPADRIFPTSCKQWVEATPHVVSLTKEKMLGPMRADICKFCPLVIQ